jgi:hypothetical protein
MTEQETLNMQLKDEYSALAKALGFKGVGWFDDPLESHAVILAHAKKVQAVYTAHMNYEL